MLVAGVTTGAATGSLAMTEGELPIEAPMSQEPLAIQDSIIDMMGFESLCELGDACIAPNVCLDWCFECIMNALLRCSRK
jgi:hypothetical protein